MAEENKQRRFLWLDLETTGLEDGKDLILEAAWWPSRSGNPLDLREQDLKSYTVHVDGETLGRALNPAAWAMHGKSGLLADVIKSTSTLDQMGWEIDRSMDRAEKLPDASYFRGTTEWFLAGNTVHFDKRFVTVAGRTIDRFAVLTKRLHYRILDVSSFKLAAASLGYMYEKVEAAHRAIDDVRASVIEYAKTLDWLTRQNGVRLPDNQDVLTKWSKDTMLALDELTSGA